MEQNIDRKALIRAAFAAREYAYTPSSNFKVGAALPSVQPCLRL